MIEYQRSENMEAKKCPVCGNVSTGKFCTGCGHKLAESAQHYSGQTPPQQTANQRPVQQPQYQQPAQQPQYQQPQYQQPVHQPQYQQPVHQPQYQQPVQRPQYQQGYTTPPAPPAGPPQGRGTYTPEPPKKKKSKLPLIIALSLAAVLVIAAAVVGIVFALGDKTFTVTFDPAGGRIVSGQAEQEIEEGQDAKAPEVKRNGWFFEGWEGDYSGVTSDVTVTALWAEGVTVTFDPGEGQIADGEAEQLLKSGSSPTAPEASRDGYKLTGWEPALGAVTEDTVYTAQWEPIEYSPEELYEMATPSVVEIHVYDKNGEYFAQGSGFFIDTEGTVVTNYHVIEDAYSADAITSDEGSHSVLQVIAWDKELDLAIIKCDIQETAPLAITQREITTGEAVYTLGSSLGLTGTISDGIVSTASRDVDGVDCIQITAPISHGNSGGPLLNRFCEVIGINSMTFADGQNLNFAINIHLIDDLDRSNPLSMEEFYDETATGENDYMSDPGAAVLTESDYIEEEYNNIAPAANALYRDSSMGGYVDPNDWDYYVFDLSSRSEITLDLVPYYYDDAEYLWSAILDEDLNLVDTLKLNTITGETSYLSTTKTLDAGTYYVYVEIDSTLDYPFTIGAFYQLFYMTGSAGSSGSSGSSSSGGSSYNDYPDDAGAWVFEDANEAELEPNNFDITADPLSSGSWIAGYCPEGDNDYFKFTLSSQTSISSNLISYYQDDLEYLEVAILDSDLNAVGWMIPYESTEGEYLAFNATLSAGTYYYCVKLSDGYYPFDIGAFYELMVHW